jgi:hypothetical protein
MLLAAVRAVPVESTKTFVALALQKPLSMVLDGPEA